MRDLTRLKSLQALEASARHEAEHFQRGNVRPVQILDNEQQRALRQPPLEDGAYRIEDLSPQLFRLDVP